MSSEAAARTSRAWLLLLVANSAVALVAIGRWGWATAQHVPIMYGEGAVAHAALLARGGREYAEPAGSTLFVAANYTPLYFHLASFGDPFVTGRIASIAATLFVALAIALRSRTGGAVLACALAATWIAAAPVSVWGAVVKPDLVSVGFTVAAVVALDGRRAALDRRRAALGGVLVALAVATKPTELVPAAALTAYLLMRDRRGLVAFCAAAAIALALVSLATHVPDAALAEHVVTWNALGWSASQALLLAVLAAAVAGATVAAAAIVRPSGPAAAYLVGAIGIAALGGREGATFNYLIDLIAAALLVIAAVAPRLRAVPLYPLAAVAQTALALALLDPLGILPGHAITTGVWSPPQRAAVVAGIGGDLLVEDAGLLVANGREPAVDDVFLWSRLRERGLVDDRLLDAVRAARFAAIVSEADLSRLDAAPQYERQRWHPDLVTAVLSRYALAGVDSGLYVYRAK